MEGEFRLHHGSATTEKAAQAAGRVEAIVGDVVNGNRKAWGRIDVEDIALLVQHARDAAASPDWLSKMAIDALVTRWETAKAERAAATARAEAAEQRAEAVVADAQAAAHFAQSVAHLLASPGAEAEAVQHLRAADLPHLLDCLRERLSEQRAEALSAEVARLRTDALLLAGLANHRAVYEMDGHDAEALDVAAERADEAADGVVIDVIRRALWGEAASEQS